MFDSILRDINHSFRSGNMITRIIFVNAIIFVVLVLLRVFTYSFTNNSNSIFYTTLVHDYLATPGYWKELILKPWTLLTSIFVHEGIWHIAWNMIVLYWFGRIVGDLLGDRKILPLFLLGGILGSFVFSCAFSIIYGVNTAYALGASAGVMAIVVAAGVTSPDYIIHLPILGGVRLKYIVLVILVMDVLGTIGSNSGGAFAHLGGAALGAYYVNQLRNGKDIGEWVNQLISWVSGLFTSVPQSNLKVVHKKKTARPSQTARSEDTQNQIDQILEKIKVNGFENLSDEEKEILYRASKS